MNSTKAEDPESFKQQAARRRDERKCAHAGGPRFRGDDDLPCGSPLPMTPSLRAGIIAAIATLAIDQASNLWLLYAFDIVLRGARRVTPFFHLLLARRP